MTLTRRDAILISLGRGDQVALEREQQSALDIVRGAMKPEPPPAEPLPPPSFLRRIRLRLFG